MLPAILSLLFNALYFSLRLSSSGSFPRPLSAAEEKELLERCADGDATAKNTLIEHNLRLVAHIIKKYYAASKEQDDLISIGTIGLIKAVNSFDVSKNTRLATYAARCIENEIFMYFRSIRRLSCEVSLSEPIDTDKDGNILELMDIISCDDCLLEHVDAKDKTALLLGFVNTCLEKREKDILVMRYGLDNRHPLTQREIAARCGISRSYVSRIEKRALKKLERAFCEAGV